MAALFVLLIRVYQLTLSKLLVALFGPICRFEPSCSRYAILCLQGHGVLRGSLLSVKRLCRCHPFHPGGFDPPPPPENSTDRQQPGDGSRVDLRSNSPVDLRSSSPVDLGSNPPLDLSSSSPVDLGSNPPSTPGRNPFATFRSMPTPGRQSNTPT